MGELGELAKRNSSYKALDVDVLGISVDPLDQARITQRKFDIPFPVLSDAQHTVMNSYGAKAPSAPGSMLSAHGAALNPALILIDKTGTIRWIDIMHKQSVTGRAAIAESLAKARKLKSSEAL